MHSDLKTKNILLTRDQATAKIADVGLAQFMVTPHQLKFGCSTDCVSTWCCPNRLASDWVSYSLHWQIADSAAPWYPARRGRHTFKSENVAWTFAYAAPELLLNANCSAKVGILSIHQSLAFVHLSA